MNADNVDLNDQNLRTLPSNCFSDPVYPRQSAAETQSKAASRADAVAAALQGVVTLKKESPTWS